jgi:hypothetical protein
MAHLEVALLQPNSQAQEILQKKAIASFLKYWHSPYTHLSDNSWLEKLGHGRLFGNSTSLASGTAGEERRDELMKKFLADYGLGSTFRTCGGDAVSLARVVHKHMEGNQNEVAGFQALLHDVRDVRDITKYRPKN